jgi:RND superfamily putative drug exporter
MLGGQTLIVSMGFALSFGIFIAAFVMAMFFTPSLTALIGHAAWWPGHGDETAEEHDARVGQALPVAASERQALADDAR